jgi:hypothetical protein
MDISQMPILLFKSSTLIFYGTFFALAMTVRPKFAHFQPDLIQTNKNGMCCLSQPL